MINEHTTPNSTAPCTLERPNFDAHHRKKITLRLLEKPAIRDYGMSNNSFAQVFRSLFDVFGVGFWEPFELSTMAQ